jgi:hypothetical protein
MGIVVGGATFDRLFVGVRFEDTATELEESFALHMAIIATELLNREVGIVRVLPKQLAR